MPRATLAVAFIALLLAPLDLRGQVIGHNFTGSSRTQSGFIPPDTMGAIGPDHFVELINGRFAIYDRFGSNNPDGTRTPLAASSLNQFWINAGVTPQGAFAFDPRVVYDHGSGRWFAVAVDNIRAANNLLVAVSLSADPTGPWNAFALDSDAANGRWADFPMLGYNADGIYISANMLDVGGSVGNQQTTIVAIPKGDLLAPAPTVANARFFENLIATAATSAHPIQNYDNASGNAGFLSFAGPLRRTDLVGPIATATISGPVITSVNSMGNPPTADQPDNFATGSQTPKANLHTLDTRISGAPVLQDGVIWGVQTTSVNFIAALQWFKIRASDNVVLQTGVLTAPNLYFYYGSIAVNEFGDVVIAASGSGPDQFVSSFAFVGDSLGDTVEGTTTFGAPMLLKAGVDDYERLDANLRNRWGDYSATTLDPLDPFSFWTVQQFVCDDNEYALQVTQILIPEPASLISAIALAGVGLLSRRARRT